MSAPRSIEEAATGINAIFERATSAKLALLPNAESTIEFVQRCTIDEQGRCTCRLNVTRGEETLAVVVSIKRSGDHFILSERISGEDASDEAALDCHIEFHDESLVVVPIDPGNSAGFIKATWEFDGTSIRGTKRFTDGRTEAWSSEIV